jgi:hypothetical protein
MWNTKSKTAYIGGAVIGSAVSGALASVCLQISEWCFWGWPVWFVGESWAVENQVEGLQYYLRLVAALWEPFLQGLLTGLVLGVVTLLVAMIWRNILKIMQAALFWAFVFVAFAGAQMAATGGNRHIGFVAAAIFVYGAVGACYGACSVCVARYVSFTLDKGLPSMAQDDRVES